MVSVKNIFKHFKSDAQAGIITGAMAVPLSAGICLMSDYPIQTGLITVVFACIIGFVSSLFKPGNYVGVPGIAAGLAPVLALGVASFGLHNMAFCILLTSIMQAVAWKFDLHRFILRYVPLYLVEGLLAGIGLRIAVKFIPFLHETVHDSTMKTIEIWVLSGLSFFIFILLFNKLSKTSPGIPYFVVIIIGIITALVLELPKVAVDNIPFVLQFPIPHIEGNAMDVMIVVLSMIGFSAMLASIDIIEQVMSNAAIEKIDPLNRKCNTSNSLFAIWVANLGSSFFGGMTNLDGLAKSTTNALAGAVTKLSNLFTALVVSIFIIRPDLLSFIPKYSLGIIMVFTGWKMIYGLKRIIAQGEYPLILSIVCGIFVFQMGIFEGLLIAMALHVFIKISGYLLEDKSFQKILRHLRKRISEDRKNKE